MVEQETELKTEIVSPVKKDVGEDEESTKPSLLEMKIIRQVEYYFGNVNLWRDKFLKEKVLEDEGWVTIECLTTFNRLQALSLDFEEIVKALSKSKTGLLEIHEDRLKVRRSKENPLPDRDDPILRKSSKLKTLYMKGFPKEYTLDDVQDFILTQECQNIFVKMRTDNEKKFKGSIIVELATINEAKKLLTTELKIGEEVLKVMTREDYFQSKGGKEGKPGGGFDAKARGEDHRDNTEDQEPEKLGCVLHFKGANESTSREDLKEVFGKQDEEIAWVDFSIGETQGYIRFKNEGGAKKVLDALNADPESKIIVKENELEVRVIEGIEEKNYWILAMEDKKRPRFNNRQGNRGGNRGRRKKGQENWRKRARPWEHPRSDNKDDKPKNSHTKFEDNVDSTENVPTETKDSVPTEAKDSNETVEKKAKVEVTTEES